MAVVLLMGGVPAGGQDRRQDDKKGGTQTVVAEGVGETPSIALKDAFRNAVRQVVGAVVDANTVIENDEIIEDSILTYSDGFVTSHEERGRSKNKQDGLYSITIEAQVERRNVVAALKAANISTKAVDGKGLFAEAVTQLDAEKSAEALLAKQFEDFPLCCLTAEVVGTPQLISKTEDDATVEITIRIEPDLNAYKAFAARLLPVLERSATELAAFTARFDKPPAQSSEAALYAIGDGAFGNIWMMTTWMPNAFNGQGARKEVRSDTLTLAVATSRSKSADKIDFRVFALDPSLQRSLVELASRFGDVVVELKDEDDESLATEHISLRSAALTTAFGPTTTGGGLYELGLTSTDHGDGWLLHARKNAFVFMVCPTFFSHRTNALTQQPKIEMAVRFTLPHEDLRAVKEAVVSLTEGG